jgi:hypothetical protein
MTIVLLVLSFLLAPAFVAPSLTLSLIDRLEGVICAGVMQSHRYMRLSCIGLTFYTVRYLGAWALVLVIAVPFFLTRGTIEALQERFPKK